MGISGEKESKIKSYLGVALALGGIFYNTEWATIAQHLPELLGTVLSVFGIGLAATGPSVTKRS